ncbi:MAG: hypothetical protein MZV70_16715 [Desulfobacterales bacterium]|nr:hypothetical protein [Desulfobacterales bacterium]
MLGREGIALHINHLFIQMSGAWDQKTAAEAAAKAAEENRDLNERAYQEELVETKDVIESQLTESTMKAQYQKSLYDHLAAQVHLDFVIGRGRVTRLIHGDR